MGDWKDDAALFFGNRATHVTDAPSVEELCFISGRDPRIWSREDARCEMVENILGQLEVGLDAEVLEVGCAAGFVAREVAPHVRRYVGVDMAVEALDIARRLGLENAELICAEGGALPFPDGTFDGAFCYNVFTNFPSFSVGADVIQEMLRVVRPGGRVQIGVVPDDALREAFLARAPVLAQELERRYGPVMPLARKKHSKEGLLQTLKRWLGVKEIADEVISDRGAISCYFFNRNDFSDLAQKLGVELKFLPLHPLNPHAEYRFNAIFSRVTS